MRRLRGREHGALVQRTAAREAAASADSWPGRPGERSRKAEPPGGREWQCKGVPDAVVAFCLRCSVSNTGPDDKTVAHHQVAVQSASSAAAAASTLANQLSKAETQELLEGLLNTSPCASEDAQPLLVRALGLESPAEVRPASPPCCFFE
jgi:hypothetical protein